MCILHLDKQGRHEIINKMVCTLLDHKKIMVCTLLDHKQNGMYTLRS